MQIRRQKCRYRRTVRLHVRRGQIFEDSFHQLKNQSPEELKARLAIRFHDEEGVDAGGVAREWFLVLSRAIFDRNYCLFRAAADNANVFQPDKRSHLNPDHLRFFRFVGRFVGKALWEGQRLDAYFTRSFYKHMLQIPPVPSDLESVDRGFYKNLQWMLSTDIDELGLEQTFTTTTDHFGRKREVELKPNGANIVVNDANKTEYIALVTDWELTTGIRAQLDAFLAGFRELMTPKLISLFNPQELELLICGLPEVDVDDLRANTMYKGWQPGSRVVRWFWDIVSDFTEADKAKLLLFVTGTSRVPIEGFSHLRGMNGLQRFQISRGSGTDRLPSAHTCFNQLELPSYSNKRKLLEKLLLAIQEGSEGFAFA